MQMQAQVLVLNNTVRPLFYTEKYCQDTLVGALSRHSGQRTQSSFPTDLPAMQFQDYSQNPQRVPGGGGGGGVLDFGLDGGVPPGPRDPNP